MAGEGMREGTRQVLYYVYCACTLLYCRWLSGPMQILVKSFVNIWTAKEIGLTKKLNCYWFFARYIIFAGTRPCPPARCMRSPLHA